MFKKNSLYSICAILVVLCLLPFHNLQAQNDVIALSDPVIVTDEFEVYGSEISDDYSISELKLAESFDLNQKPEKEFYFEGTLTEVCQARGCNFLLDDGEYQVRVRFKDDSFFIPTNTAGKKSLVRGEFVQRNGSDIEISSSAIKIYN